MAYYVYHNWTVQRPGKLVLHAGSCPFCNEGKGIHPDSGARNGEWLGQYRTAGEAQAAMRRLSGNLRPCGFCGAR